LLINEKKIFKRASVSIKILEDIGWRFEDKIKKGLVFVVVWKTTLSTWRISNFEEGETGEGPYLDPQILSSKPHKTCRNSSRLFIEKLKPSSYLNK